MVWGGIVHLHRRSHFPLHVAAAIGKGTIDPGIIDQYVIFWHPGRGYFLNVITWYFGIPSSSSHVLIGGLVGAALVKSGLSALVGSSLFKIVAYRGSPLGFVLA